MIVATVFKVALEPGPPEATIASLSAPTQAVHTEARAVCARLAHVDVRRRISRRCRLHRANQEVDVNVCELHITGVEGGPQLSAARWQLFVCRAVRDLRRGSDGLTEVVYEGEAHVERWLRILEEAGYDARPAEQTSAPLEAA